jgi:hypothetical protein
MRAPFARTPAELSNGTPSPRAAPAASTSYGMRWCGEIPASWTDPAPALKVYCVRDPFSPTWRRQEAGR